MFTECITEHECCAQRVNAAFSSEKNYAGHFHLKSSLLFYLKKENTTKRKESEGFFKSVGEWEREKEKVKEKIYIKDCLIVCEIHLLQSIFFLFFFFFFFKIHSKFITVTSCATIIWRRLVCMNN